MIKHFNDHAANERTYLAWLRTAIALLAFGFVVEKFNLFIEILVRNNTQQPIRSEHFLSGSWMGIVLMLLAIVIIVIASIRFSINRRQINAEDTYTYQSRIPDVFLGILLTTITIFMLIYVFLAIF